MDPREWALAVARLERRLTPADLKPGGAKRGLATHHPGADDGLDLASAIVRAATESADGVIDEATAWERIMTAARSAQRQFKSWRELGESWVQGWYQLTDGRGGIEGYRADVERELADPESPWNLLPWDTDLDPLPVRQRFGVAIAAPLVLGDGGDPQWLGGARFDARERGRAHVSYAARLHSRFGVTNREQLMAFLRVRLHGSGERALELARAVAAAGYAVHAQIMTEADAWQVVLIAGKLAQQAYTSWDDLGDGYLRAWRASGGADEPAATHVAACKRGAWAQLPWHTELEVQIAPAPQPEVPRGLADSPAARWALALASLQERLSPRDLARGSREVRWPLGRDVLDRMMGESQTDAFAMTSTIHALADASAAGVLDEARAWELILQLADRAQQVFGSWREFGASYSACIEQASDGRASGDAEVAAALNDPDHPWNALPWETPLIPQRQAWALAIAAPLVVEAGGDPRHVAGVRYRADAADALYERAAGWLATHDIETTDGLIAYVNARLAAPGDRALELARAIAVLEYGVHARLVPEADAWFVALSAAALAQRAFASWAAFGDAFERAWQAAGHAVEPMSSQVAALRRGLWSTLPWGMDLQVDITGDGRPRILKITCGTCDTPRARPSMSPYVYCDVCGEFLTYDFACVSVREAPVRSPPPAYAAVHAELAPALAAAQAAGDRDAFHKLQIRLADAGIDHTANELSPRIRDAGYRKRYVEYIAAAATACAFDATCREREAAMLAATTTLVTSMQRGTRVTAATFAPVADAVFAYTERRAALLAEQRVDVQHPDARVEVDADVRDTIAPVALIRATELATFVRAWLPFLDAATGDALVERAGLARAYTTDVMPPRLRAAVCEHCAQPLRVVARAYRVVCEHCGRHAGVVANTT